MMHWGNDKWCLKQSVQDMWHYYFVLKPTRYRNLTSKSVTFRVYECDVMLIRRDNDNKSGCECLGRDTIRFHTWRRMDTLFMPSPTVWERVGCSCTQSSLLKCHRSASKLPQIRKKLYCRFCEVLPPSSWHFPASKHFHTLKKTSILMFSQWDGELISTSRPARKETAIWMLLQLYLLLTPGKCPQRGTVYHLEWGLLAIGTEHTQESNCHFSFTFLKRLFPNETGIWISCCCLNDCIQNYLHGQKKVHERAHKQKL